MSANSLAIYEKMNDPIDAVKVLGMAFAKSGMFGCGSVEQGQIFALECLARGMPPLTLAERFHVVQGKLMMKYDAMLAEFHALGGKHKIVSRTEEKAEIELSIDGETHRESLTWDQAKGEKWPFGKDGKTIKDNWATPRARRQMLWARVVSEGVRALRPGVNNGRYVDEEIERDDEPRPTNGNGNGNGHAKPASTASVVESADVLEGEVVQKQPATESPAAPDAASATEPPRIDRGQRDKIVELFLKLKIPVEKQNEIVRKRGVGALAAFSKQQADELLLGLQAKLDKIAAAGKVEAESMGGESKAVASISTTPAMPCTPDQIDKAKQLLGEHKQIDKTFNERLKAKLVASGKQKIADLSEGDANRLIEFLERKAAEKFFELSLEICAAIKADDEAAKDATASEGESKN